MAFEYQNFASLGVNLNRQKYGPLDISNVFTSEADLKYYLSKGNFTEGVSEYWTKVVPYPYEGQVLATVIGGEVNVYVLAEKEDGTFETREIAGKIEADGKTVKVDDEGKITLVGLEAVEAGKTYVPSLVNGVLTWAEPDTSTAEGQAQEINALKTRAAALEEAVNGKGEGEEHVKGLVEKVSDNAQAIIDEISAREETDLAILGKIGDVAEGKTVVGLISEAEQTAKDYADSLASNYEVAGAGAEALQDAKDYADSLAVNYDASGSAAQALVDAKTYADGLASNYDVAGTADTALASAKSYTDEEIAGLKVSIEQKDGIEYIVVKDKDNEEITSVNASKFVQDSFLNDVSYDASTGKINFVWTMGDGSTKTDEIDIAHLVDTYTSGNGIVIENNVVSIDTEVVATVEALEEVRELADAAQTAEEVSDAIDAKIAAENLSKYAVKSDVNAELAQKVDSSILEGYYTKTEIENKGYAIASDVENTYATKEMLIEHEGDIANELLNYAKSSDVNAELAKKIENATIAHSTDSLAEGVTVEGNQLKIVVDAYSKEETLAKIEEKITSFTGGESAADVKLALDNYEETNNARVGAIETKNSDQDAAIAKAQEDATKGITDAKKVSEDLAALDARVVSNTNEIGVVKNTITNVNETLSGKISGLESKDTEFTGEISGLKTTVNGHSATIGEHTASISALQDTDTELAALIQGNTNKFANYYTKGEIDTTVQDIVNQIPDITPYAKASEVNAELAKKANNDDVYTIAQANAQFMTESQVADKINALINAADPEGGKTIENITKLVEYVDTNAGEIAQLVSDVATNTAAHEANAESIRQINESIAAMVSPRASDEILVASDGTLSIKEVSVNKLVQSEGDTLILNGGDSIDANIAE